MATDAEDLRSFGTATRLETPDAPVLEGVAQENQLESFIGVCKRRTAMRTTRSSIIIAIATLAVAALGGLTARAAPGDGIAGTAHDFTAYNGTMNVEDVGLCTFCHTPHRAQTTRLLWNHTLSAETYSWSDITNTTGGTPLPSFDASWQGVSKNCLSCHDGTVAIGDVAWFNETGPAYEILDHRHDTVADAALITFASGDGGGGDMSGNHPVAHPFPFQGVASTYNSTTTGTSALGSGWVADPTANGIRLFNDAGGEVTAGGVAGSTGIECSSCHDPHNGPNVPEEKFLRGTMTGNTTDYLCLKCHDK